MRGNNKKACVILESIVLIFIFAITATEGAEWAKIYGRVPTGPLHTGHESALSVQPVSDGGYVVAGFAYDYLPISRPVTGTWILKLNSNGITEWAAELGGVPSSVQPTSDFGCIIAGATADGVYQDPVLTKLSREGKLEWRKVYKSASHLAAVSTQQTEDGGYIVGGWVFINGSIDVWILKLSTAGEIQWQKTYGGLGSDSVNAIKQTSDGGFITVGDSDSFGSHGIWVLKLDGNGQIQWQNLYEADESYSGKSVLQTQDGGYIIGGMAKSIPFVSKLDKNGEIEWQRGYSVSQDNDSSIFYISQQTSDNGYIIAAGSLILKLTDKGDVQWQKAYDGIDLASSSYQTSDGGYIVAGSSGLYTSSSDIYVLKLNDHGDIPNCAVLLEPSVSTTGINLKMKGTDGNSIDIEGNYYDSPGAAYGSQIVENQICNTDETISTPNMPSGPTEGKLGISYTFSVGGALSNLGHPVQYGLLWGDGTGSGWLPVGATSASKSWSKPGTYSVEVRARCSVDNSVVSRHSEMVIDIVVPISLQSPDVQEEFGTCSIYSPPLFSWLVSETFSQFEIQFSKYLSFDDFLRFEVQWPETQLSISLSSWRDILAISEVNSGYIEWRVIGKREDGTTGTSDASSLIIKWNSAGSPSISPTSRKSKPTLTWQTNCNTKFKVWFGSDGSFSKKSYLFQIENPSGEERIISKALTAQQWMRIKMLIKNKKGSTIYWYIESWDELGRFAKTDVMSFNLTD